MTRFSIDLEQSSKLVMWTLQNSFGNEIVIPKMKSYKILDLARAVNKECKIKFIGKRPGEKIHEEIISEFDDRCKILLDDKYLLINKKDLKKYRKLIKKYNGEILNENFGFNSKDNDYLNMKELKDIIKKS
jgi:FlaA1/EpsC-like NDP-sugar epimerase